NEKFNFLLEGDNLHSLYLLEKTHKGKIDCIYIDPPYNTGGKDFMYGDTYLETEDEYRHSKWLSFMNQRLLIAKRLLSDTGVIFISIDDNEAMNLKLLCDSIFDEHNTDIMVWRKSGDGRDGKMKNTTTFRKDHEYIICCFKRLKVLNKITELPNFVNTYPNNDNDPRGPYKAGSISRKESASNPNSKNFYTVCTPKGTRITRQFDISKEEFEILNSDYAINSEGRKVSRIYWGKNNDSVPSVKIFTQENRNITPYSVLLQKGTTTNGTKELNKILNGDYSSMRPKPSTLIQTLIQLGSKKNSIILDFFAGTGTTAQACMQQNLIDGGSRNYILCTNNENDICEKVTYKRISHIMDNYIDFNGRPAVGIKHNLKYYKTTFVPRINAEKENLHNNLLINIKNLIQLENGIEIDDNQIRIYLDEYELDTFSNNKEALKVCDKVYISSDILLTSKQEKIFRDNNIKVYVIPEYYFKDEIMEVL
ncbi:MAG: site-specific DNA-methyltransferase, partial [Clostridia bacterium]